MHWYLYLLIYWVLGIIITTAFRLYNKKDEKLKLKDIISVILFGPIAILFLPIIGIQEFYTKKKDENFHKKIENEEKAIKAKLGLKPDEVYMTFEKLGGAGTIHCLECGHQQDIVSFVHGANSCHIGRQCPKCHAFSTEYNESEKYHTFGKSKEDYKCPECDTVIRKKDESIMKGNDSPLFCPKCHSARLHYSLAYMT